MQPVLTPEQLLQAREVVRSIYVDGRIKDYVLDLVLRHPRRPHDFGLADLKPLITSGRLAARRPSA